MTLKYIFFAAALLLASPLRAEDAGLRYIKSRGVIRCGTTLDSRAFAYKDEDKKWQGFDADICRSFAATIFGSDQYFELVDVPQSEAAKALNAGKVDVMLGNLPYSASLDVTRKIIPAGVLYFDRQVFAAKNPDDATSMLKFKGKPVCAVTDSEELYNLDIYNREYQLKLKVVKFPNQQKAKEAFMLNRCALWTGNEVFLKSAIVDNAKSQAKVLPEIITSKPVYAYVSRENTRLQSTISWIINNLYLAEEYGITTNNVELLSAAQDTSIRNMLGLTPELWKKFEVSPQGFRLALKNYGNYSEIFNRNLGGYSPINIERTAGKLSHQGGVITPRPFL